jgi:hypothetical protein
MFFSVKWINVKHAIAKKMFAIQFMITICSIFSFLFQVWRDQL